MDNAVLSQRIEQIYAASDRIYGMPKIWYELRDTHDAQHDPRWAKVGRNRVARLMRQHGLRGVSRRRGFTITTEVDKTDRCAPDLVNRQFEAQGPAYSGDVGTAFRSMSVRDSDLMSVRRTDGQ